MDWHNNRLLYVVFFSLVYILSAFASPVFGFLIDKTGKNIFWVMMGVLVTMGAHGLLAFTFVNPYVAMVSTNRQLRIERQKGLTVGRYHNSYR